MQSDVVNDWDHTTFSGNYYNARTGCYKTWDNGSVKHNDYLDQKSTHAVKTATCTVLMINWLESVNTAIISVRSQAKGLKRTNCTVRGEHVGHQSIGLQRLRISGEKSGNGSC